MNLRTGPFRHVLLTMLCGAGTGAALGLACGEDHDARPGVLEHIAFEVAVPAVTEFAARAEATAGALETLCAGPKTGALEAARAAWSEQRGAFSRLIPLRLGPTVEALPSLDFWPVRIDTVEAAITGAPATVDAAYLGTLGTSAKGMPALEYLLWGEDATRVLAALTEPSTGARRCAYAKLLADDLAARTAALRDAWDPAYADAVAGRDAAVYASLKLALDDVVNHEIDGLATMVKAKLDTPLGNLSGAAVDPTLLESRFSARSKHDLQDSLTGVWAVYHGADPQADAAGLSVLVRERDPDLDDRVRAQYARTIMVLDAVPEPLAATLTADRNAVQLARDEIDTLRRMIKLDVASQLGVTLSLSDNDGD